MPTLPVSSFVWLSLGFGLAQRRAERMEFWGAKGGESPPPYPCGLARPPPLSLLSWLVILSQEDAFPPSLLLSLSPNPSLLVFIVSLL